MIIPAIDLIVDVSSDFTKGTMAQSVAMVTIR